MIDLRFKKFPCREESGQELLPVKFCSDERTRHPQIRGRRDGARLVRADDRGDRADARRGPELRDVGALGGAGFDADDHALAAARKLPAVARLRGGRRVFVGGAAGAGRFCLGQI
jgi:hypothetical protein